MPELTIRPAIEADLPLLVRIEVEAGQLFRTVGLDEVAEHPVAEDDYRRSRLIGQDMHRGPPRPEPSSEPEMAITSMPACSSRVLVSTFRS
jgi:hypothetical protein